MPNAQGLEIGDPKSLIVRSSQVSPPELQIHCKNEKGEGSYQSDSFKEIVHEGSHVSCDIVECNSIYESNHGNYS